MAEQMMTPNSNLASRLAIVKYLDVDASRTAELGQYDAVERKALWEVARAGGTPMSAEDARQLVLSFEGTTQYVAEINDPTLIEDLFSWVGECKGVPIDEIAIALTEGVEALISEHLDGLSDAQLRAVHSACYDLDAGGIRYECGNAPGLVANSALSRRN